MYVIIGLVIFFVILSVTDKSENRIRVCSRCGGKFRTAHETVCKQCGGSNDDS